MRHGMRVVLCAATIVALGGCGWWGSGEADPKTIEPRVKEATSPAPQSPLPQSPPPEPVTEKEQSASVPDKPLQSVSSASRVSLPPDFPEDVPIYTEAVIRSLGRAPQGRGLHLSYDVKDPLDVVAEFYQEMGQKAGWTVFDESSGGDSHARLRLEKNQRQAYVALSSEGEKTRCTVTVSR